MNESAHNDAEALAEEISRYLTAVDVFRSVGCEPIWRPESVRQPTVPAETSVPFANARLAH